MLNIFRTAMIQRILGFLFLLLTVSALVQCARRGAPSGGDKDVTPPKLVKAEPENMSINFNTNKIRLYFDEYVKLKDIEKQLIVSPPLKYTPLISPQGSANKYVEIILKDTLKENTTYTFNFGQSIIDNNEGNPFSYFTYVFSTGDYIDSLKVSGVVKDAFNKNADTFISIMLYEIDSTYTDSTIYRQPPNYITNTLDSTPIFHLKNLKEGQYAMFGLKDEAKNNIFNQKVDKIAFIKDTITLPTDSVYLLTMFKELPDYSISVPNFAAKNKIIFGYQGNAKEISISTLSNIPDTVKTKITKEREKDTLNFWFTPFNADSLVFTVANEKERLIDTFTVKTKKVGVDTLIVQPNQRGSLDFGNPFYIGTNTPISRMDSSKIRMERKDSTLVNFITSLDTIGNKIDFDFEVEPNESYTLDLLPGAIVDFFDTENDTISIKLTTKSYADFGNLRLTLDGTVTYPLIVQLTDEKGVTVKELFANEQQVFEFTHIKPAKYLIRIIFDSNGNQKWDTGNYLQRIQPEKVTYYPKVLEVRANWELEQTFTLSD
ncbi:Ig-like domain-containing protein [Arenibacter sp. ARW7G5Y1]|uniref:Ig-like domain-containing protein n=1 Tax=Arenibacter sp. ARW7G5Y1 TaxID=2135619 RepID=UPI000D963CCC|nr:Ig-like domain-containing protein [Arenibacter sp. ARW7G5Y1]PXX31486.1 Ig-like domain-containing protein [Arenibacter sp. ARW7G5Y1]